MKQQKQYLELLAPNDTEFLFACFDYRKQKPPKTFYGTLVDLFDDLQRANDEGYCVYVTVNKTDGTFNEKGTPQRKKKNVTNCRAIWVEDDSIEIEPRDDFPIEPSFIVRSSKNKYHYYWLTNTTEFAQWEAVMMGMVANWGCDPNARDISRVLRLPGFLNNKKAVDQDSVIFIKGTGKTFDWDELHEIYPELEKEKKEEKSSLNSDFNLPDSIEKIINSENYHNSLASISLSLVNNNVPREVALFCLKSIMQGVPVEKRREEFDDRASDEHLLECIDSAINKVEDEDTSDDVDVESLLDPTDDEVFGSRLTFPPGDMGDLCKEILEMAPHPNKIISIAAGIGLIAGITGRKFNVSGFGLNLYITILADSGIGKANLKDSINRALRGGPLNQGANFAGYSRFTGPKAIFDMLQDGMSRICILEEAGLLSESKSGDQQGISRATLDLFTSSGFQKFSGNEGYSDKNNSIPNLESPALSMVSISTPRSYLNSMKTKSSELSGEIARMWLMRSTENKNYFNENMRTDFRKETRKKINDLVTLCLTAQKSDVDYKIIDVGIPKKYYKDSKRWVDLENKYKMEGDNLRRTLCSRAWAKVLKMASVISVYNGKSKIGDDEYEWATMAVEQELEFIKLTFTHEGVDNLDNIAKSAVYRPIVHMLQNKYGDKSKKTPSLDLRQQGIFTLGNLKQVVRNNALLTELDDDPLSFNPKTGLEKILNYMIRSGQLVEMKREQLHILGCKSKIGYKITSDFSLMNLPE